MLASLTKAGCRKLAECFGVADFCVLAPFLVGGEWKARGQVLGLVFASVLIRSHCLAGELGLLWIFGIGTGFLTACYAGFCLPVQGHFHGLHACATDSQSILLG